MSGFHQENHPHFPLSRKYSFQIHCAFTPNKSLLRAEYATEYSVRAPKRQSRANL